MSGWEIYGTLSVIAFVLIFMESGQPESFKKRIGFNLRTTFTLILYLVALPCILLFLGLVALLLISDLLKTPKGHVERLLNYDLTKLFKKGHQNE